MLKCEICSSEDNIKLTCESGVWACRNCLSKRFAGNESSVGIIEKETVGSLRGIWKSKVRELDRRHMIPCPTAPGGYITGRRNENGTISDRATDIR